MSISEYTFKVLLIGRKKVKKEFLKKYLQNPFEVTNISILGVEFYLKKFSLRKK